MAKKVMDVMALPSRVRTKLALLAAKNQRFPKSELHAVSAKSMISQSIIVEIGGDYVITMPWYNAIKKGMPKRVASAAPAQEAK